MDIGWICNYYFREVAAETRTKYENAKKVKNSEIEHSDSLIYSTDENYCDRNKAVEFPGTIGRECGVIEQNKKGSNCENLCCGRGVETTKTTVKVTKRETCKFHWNTINSKPWMDCQQETQTRR